MLFCIQFLSVLRKFIQQTTNLPADSAWLAPALDSMAQIDYIVLETECEQAMDDVLAKPRRNKFTKTNQLK